MKNCGITRVLTETTIHFSAGLYAYPSSDEFTFIRGVLLGAEPTRSPCKRYYLSRCAIFSKYALVTANVSVPLATGRSKLLRGAIEPRGKGIQCKQLFTSFRPESNLFCLFVILYFRKGTHVAGFGKNYTCCRLQIVSLIQHIFRSTIFFLCVLSVGFLYITCSSQSPTFFCHFL